MEYYSLLLIGLPLIFALYFAVSSSWHQTPEKQGGLHVAATLFAAITFIVSLFGLNPAIGKDSFHLPWFPNLGISLAFGGDGVSVTLTILTALLTLLAVVASYTNIKSRLNLYYSMLFVLAASLFGVFLSRDLFQFFLFYELELIPMFLLIAIWGGPNRKYASIKFVLYTLFGSVFLFSGILLYFFLASRVNGVQPDLFMFSSLAEFAHVNSQSMIGPMITLFMLLFVAFAVKLPMVPFHTWLPDAHVEAPTPVSMLLAGILLKMGGYGMYRLCFEYQFQAAERVAPLLVLFAIINIVYTAGIALVQKDMKKLIAYSSVSHMGFVILGLAAMNVFGWMGAAFVLVAHGIVSAGLFMAVGTLYSRTHTREIAQYGGFASITPIIYYFFLVMSLASLGLPGLISFAGESLVFYGAYLSNVAADLPLLGTVSYMQLMTAIASLGLILGAAYSLSLVKRLFTGTPNEKWLKLPDIDPSEYVVLGTLTVIALVIGFYPKLLTDRFGSLQPWNPEGLSWSTPAAPVHAAKPPVVLAAKNEQ
jgi:NADH-quinone oxidoreductase subunit M